MSIKFSEIIEKYNGESDFAEWVEKLEMVASLQGITDLASFLPLFLTGGSFSVYKGLTETVRKDYTKLKKSLLDVFSSDKFTVYETLVMRKLEIGESVDVYLADIKRMIRLIDASYALEHFIVAAFVSGLPSDVKQQLRAACSLSEMKLETIVNRTRALLKARNVETCCFSKGGNKSRIYASKLQERKIFCFNCGKEGHIRNYCPELSDRARRCYRCGAADHMIVNCPRMKENGRVKNEPKNE